MTIWPVSIRSSRLRFAPLPVPTWDLGYGNLKPSIGNVSILHVRFDIVIADSKLFRLSFGNSDDGNRMFWLVDMMFSWGEENL